MREGRDERDAYGVLQKVEVEGKWKEGARAMIITAIIAVFGKLLVSGRPGT